MTLLPKRRKEGGKGTWADFLVVEGIPKKVFTSKGDEDERRMKERRKGRGSRSYHAGKEEKRKKGAGEKKERAREIHLPILDKRGRKEGKTKGGKGSPPRIRPQSGEEGKGGRPGKRENRLLRILKKEKEERGGS